MLRLADPGLPAFASTKLGEYQSEVDDAGDYAERVAEGKRLFKSRNQSSNSTFRAVRKSLSKMCAGAQRCVYCEDSVGDEVEHIKPKDLYPEDVFCWENYVYACGPCNGGKNNRFAVITQIGRVDVTRARGAPVAPPAPGEPAFVNPRLEDPLALMTMDLQETYFMLPKFGLNPVEKDRTDFTIETLKLNRDPLPDARKNAFGGYYSRLLAYRSEREAGASAAELDWMRLDLLATPHPTVWEEMKRQAHAISEIGSILGAVPEVRNW